jgi:C1A family cysteine protease
MNTSTRKVETENSLLLNNSNDNNNNNNNNNVSTNFTEQMSKKTTTRPFHVYTTLALMLIGSGYVGQRVLSSTNATTSSPTSSSTTLNRDNNVMMMIMKRKTETSQQQRQQSSPKLSSLGVRPERLTQDIAKSEFSTNNPKLYNRNMIKHYTPYDQMESDLGKWGDASAMKLYKEQVKLEFDPESLGLPRHFDARKEWSECKGIIGTVRDQGKCGSCWAVAATEIMNDRACIAHGERQELSPQYALSCYSAGAGCNGGNVVDTLQEARVKGIPTGGMLGDSASACLPYEFEACDHPCQVAGTVAEQCPTTCADGTTIEDSMLIKPVSEPYECPEGDWRCIVKELHQYGSMAVTFGPVCEDFYGHRRGVYEQPEGGKPLGLHATKIIGWGFEGDDEETGKGGNPYWIMVNSWQNWGDHGVGRIGIGEMNIESEATSIKM